MPAINNFLVLSALGKDRPGIVDRLTKLVLDYDCNIIDSRMTVLGGEFAILMMIQGNWNTLAKLENALPELRSSMGLTIICERTEERQANQDMLPYMVEVVALDHPGIVHHLAGFFSQREINIEDLITGTYAAPHTGTQMFSVHMSIGIPASIHIASLRDEFMDFCDSMNLDAVLEPLKR
jgi:glycine cleavage system transcriptional repressor